MRSAFALRIISGNIIYNRAMPERPQTLRHCIFTGGVATANGSCSAAFCESAALRLASSPSQALTRQLSQRESLWRGDKVCGFAKASPFGRGAEQGEAERASLFQSYDHFSSISTVPDTCAITPSSVTAPRNPGSCCSSTASALPRWLMASFSSGVSWA